MCIYQIQQVRIQNGMENNQEIQIVTQHKFRNNSKDLNFWSKNKLFA